MQTIQFCVFYKNDLINDFLFVNSSSAGGFVISRCEEVERLHVNDNDTKVKIYKISMDGYLCSLFYYILQTSLPYANLIAARLISPYPTTSDNEKCLVKIKLVSPVKEVIDLIGNDMFEILCLERRELDSAMAWFSTLGGAFSALGDGLEKCAVIAGKISIQQFQIAWRLGDPYLMARCKLYFALSLIQRHYFSRAKQIIKEQYIFATEGTIQDLRLLSMCKGIWTKLKYDRNQYRLKKTNIAI